ncbi:MAG: trehalose-phosphatase [Halofilum sp. (in: g-proteobacteria)]|nr:trehalose-phosphatase [Halofilum sp. (in: g-proteobacteria)]
MSRDRDSLPAARPDWCLFLDCDGTLVELRDHPGDVVVPEAVIELVHELLAVLDGAVAIVSGRGVDDLARLFGVPGLALAGIHGLERRDAAGRMHRDLAAERALDAARAAVSEFVAARPGLLHEDKGGALAVHFRRDRAQADAVHAFLREQCERLDHDFHVQSGKDVYELKPSGRDKGRVVREFMGEPPFAGRRPVFVGDDDTDEHAFEAVNRLDGVSVRVGPPGRASRARYRLESVDDALAWLGSLPARIREGDKGNAGAR